MLDAFYIDVLRRLVRQGQMDLRKSTLVVAGGEVDRAVLIEVGFTDVTISNLDERFVDGQFSPYRSDYQDAENLSYEDGGFAQVIVHAGLHHCKSPHRAFLEMYRVAESSCLAFEARDSFIMGLAEKIGMTPVYEMEAVASHGLKYGGVYNTEIPNYVYRWKEKEVKKAILSFDPVSSPDFRFFYGLRLPVERLSIAKSKWKLALLRSTISLLKIFFKIFRRQSNEFAFFVKKTERRHPWIREDGKLNEEWMIENFNVS